MATSLKNKVFNSLKRKGIRCQKNYPIHDKYGMTSFMDVAILNNNGYPKALVKCTKRNRQGTSDRLVFYNYEVMKKYGVPSFIMTEGKSEGYTDGVLSSLKQACRATPNMETGKYDDFIKWSKGLK
jgi:hypothetical protein